MLLATALYCNDESFYVWAGTGLGGGGAASTKHPAWDAPSSLPRCTAPPASMLPLAERTDWGRNVEFTWVAASSFICNHWHQIHAESPTSNAVASAGMRWRRGLGSASCCVCRWTFVTDYLHHELTIGLSRCSADAFVIPLRQCAHRGCCHPYYSSQACLVVDTSPVDVVVSAQSKQVTSRRVRW